MSLTLTNTQKAAVLLMQLGQDRAARIMGLLSDSEVEEITAEIVRMGTVQTEVAQAVVRDFHDQALGGRPPVSAGGLEYAQRLLEASIGADRAAEVIDRLSSLIAGQPFDYLQQADSRQVHSLISGEHPQTIALVLAHLRPERASGILANLPPDQRADVARRIATMEQSTPEVVTIVAEHLQMKATSVLTSAEYTAVGGIEPLVEILNRSDPGTEKQTLEQLGEIDSELAEEVRTLMFTFEDVVLLDDRAVQLVVRQIDVPTLARALKGAPPKVMDKITSNLSERVRETLAEDMDVTGPVRMSVVQEARGTIVGVIRAHEESGQIVIRREEEDEYVQ